VKSRGAHHSDRHHCYLITDTGIRIDPMEYQTGGC
jgi:hypothetical protein